MSPFSQWIGGQPWWVTLLLLPAIVLAAIVARVIRYALIVGAVVGLMGVIAAVWSWRARR